MDRQRKPEQAADDKREPKYHVYVRLPFKRGNFVEPGPIDWDERKSETLWAIISDSSHADIDWTRLATQFDVSVDFLLQMANYLTERHTSQLRAQMMRAAAIRGSNAPSPVPGAEPTTTASKRRTSSGAGRASSASAFRKETATPQLRAADVHESSSSGTPGPGGIKGALPSRPGTSRHSSDSTNTAVPPQPQLSARPGTATRLNDPQRRRPTYLSGQQYQQPVMQEEEPERPASPQASDDSDDSTSSSSAVQSRIIRRPPRFGSKGNGDDDDDDEPAFLPYNPHPQAQPHLDSSHATGSSSSTHDLGATLRGDMRGLMEAGRADTNQSQTSDSSIGSAAVMVQRTGTTGGAVAAGGTGTAGTRRIPSAFGQQGTISPRRTMELSGRGPGPSKRKGASRGGSDGTPSMGSSFSDLDDASVTQSALEEALASRMQDGTIGSRMSVIGGTLGHLRSRYLPKSNR